MESHQEIKKRKGNPPDASTPVEEQQPFDQIAQQNGEGETTLPIELTNATGTRLDHLNDDCLLEIFSQNSLTDTDLCSLAETCKLFKRISQRVFAKELSIYCIDKSLYQMKAKNYLERLLGARDAERIFKNFGSGIVKLSVHGDGQHAVTNLVAKYCVVDTLKELEFLGIKFTDVLATELQPIFKQLQRLTICNSTVECSANAFANCDSLIELTVRHVTNFNAILENSFPELQRFSIASGIISSLNGLDFDNTFLSFLVRHQTLKYLNFFGPLLEALNAFLRKLGNSLMELEELEIVTYYDTTLDLSFFQNLKRLTLYRFFEEKSRVVQFQKLKSLEFLRIGGCSDSREILEVLPLLENLREFAVDLYSVKTKTLPWASLRRIRKLRLSNIPIHTINYVADVVRELGNLEELEVGPGEFVLSEKEFLEIVTLTKRRQNVLTLKCRCNFSQSRICDKNSKVKLIKVY